MNLLSRISLLYIIVSLAFIIVGGCFFFSIFKGEVYEELDEQLRDEKRNIERLLTNSDTVPVFFTGVNTEIEIVPANSDLRVKLERKDTIITHPHEGNITFRQWRYTVKQDDQNYIVVIRKSLIDLSDLSEQLIYALIIGFLVLLISATTVNYIFLKFTLRPFYNTLKQLRKYSLDNSTGLVLAKTKTKEFIELNQTIERMMNQIEEDYKRTKEFTENASHEIQTPLAIIRNKLELLMQSDEIKQEEAHLIQSAYEAVERLSRLNQSLILLTRIENKEFSHLDSVDFGLLVKKLVHLSEEKLAMKGLKIEITEQGKFIHTINGTLAEILVSNLLSNAIRYSEKGNTIKIDILERRIIFSNSGEAFSVGPEKLFQRFFKISSNSKSLGIGLSLVKTISDAYGLKIVYSYKNHTHSFSVES